MNFFNKLLRLLGLDKGLVSVAGGNAIASLTGAVFWLFVAALMSKEEYGQLNYFLSAAFLFSNLSLLGLGTTVTTFLSKGDEAVKYQANLLVLFSNCVVFVLLLIFINHLSVVLLLIGISFFGMSQAEYLGNRNYKKYSYIVIGQRLVNVPLSLSLFLIAGIDGVITGYAISTLLFSYNFFKSFKGIKLQFTSLRVKLPFMLHSYSLGISSTVANNVDKLLIAPLFCFGLLGLYQMGFQFLTFLSIIPSSLFQFLLPQEAARIQQKKVVLKGITVAVIFSISLFIAIPAIITSIFPHFKESVQVSQIMILGIIPMTISVIMYSRFFGGEKSKAVLVSSSVRVSTLLILIYFLGKIYGLVGLGFAILISLSLECITILIISKFVYHKINSNQNDSSTV